MQTSPQVQPGEPLAGGGVWEARIDAGTQVFDRDFAHHYRGPGAQDNSVISGVFYEDRNANIPDGSFDYTPDLDFNGADSFTYEAVDGVSGAKSLATVTLIVAPVNDAPDANTDAVVATCSFA